MSELRLFTTAGISMSPLIRQGDRVVVRMTGGVSSGDVIVYRMGKEMIIHRLLSKSDELTGWLIKGDNRLKPDRIKRGSVVLGKVIAVIPKEENSVLDRVRSRGLFFRFAGSAIGPFSLIQWALYKRFLRGLEQSLPKTRRRRFNSAYHTLTNPPLAALKALARLPI
jgi:signal peptidase I